MYLIVWEFIAKAGHEEKFAKAYGPTGNWVEFFRNGEGYVRTDFLHDTGVTRRYLTIDYWKSKSAYADFRSQHSRQYEKLDERCSALTESEALIGTFTVPD